MKSFLLPFKNTFIIVGSALLVSILLGIIITSVSEGTSAKAVSVPFSHKTHVENYGIKDCGKCHKYSTTGVFRGIPTVGECVVCHKRGTELFSDDRKNNPRMKSMFDFYADKDKLWNSKIKDSEIFYYSHKRIMATDSGDNTTRVKCVLCHGDKVNSAITANTKGEKLMNQCIYCHTSFKLNNQCDVCHR